jgi:hypothetical protein
MTEREIKMKLADKLEEMSRAISRGKDVEITKTSNGIAIKEVAKKKLV